MSTVKCSRCARARALLPKVVRERLEKLEQRMNAKKQKKKKESK